MKPRSIVFDLFGDYLRYAGGEVRLRALTELLDCFGIGEATVRVVMARLRKEGWFDTRRDGRETVYALNDRSWQLLDEGRHPRKEPPHGRLTTGTPRHFLRGPGPPQCPRTGRVSGLGLPGPARDRLLAGVPMRRVAALAEVVGPVLYLLSPAAGYMTGQALRLDGGAGLSQAGLYR